MGTGTGCAADASQPAPARRHSARSLMVIKPTSELTARAEAALHASINRLRAEQGLASLPPLPPSVPELWLTAQELIEAQDRHLSGVVTTDYASEMPELARAVFDFVRGDPTRLTQILAADEALRDALLALPELPTKHHVLASNDHDVEFFAPSADREFACAISGHLFQMMLPLAEIQHICRALNARAAAISAIASMTPSAQRARSPQESVDQTGELLAVRDRPSRMS